MASFTMRTFLLATAVAAQTTQFTTSLWLLKDSSGASKIGYYGSVVAANDSHATFELSYDNGTDTSALVRFPEDRITVTANPTQFELGVQNITENPYGYRIRCEEPSTSWSSNATCTIFVGSSAADDYFCEPTLTFNATSTRTILNTYSGRLSESGGVETILQTVHFNTYASVDTQTEFPDGLPSSSTQPAGWCSSKKTVGPDYASIFPASQDQFAVYQVVITAGQEKLPAETGQSASPSLPVSTGGAASGGLVRQQGVFGGLAVVAAPAVAGLVVGAAAVLL